MFSFDPLPTVLLLQNSAPKTVWTYTWVITDFAQLLKVTLCHPAAALCSLQAQDAAMRVWGQRYNRDLQRYNLALRMIAHEARTHTICDWTGLPDDRIRHLYQSYVHDQNRPVPRRRGPSPQSLAFFFGSARSRSEAAALVGLCYMLEVLPPEVVRNPRRELPGVGRGQRLCDAYEMYLSLVPETPMTLEHVVLLIMTVSEGREFEVNLCDVCGGVVVQDRGNLRHGNCAHCNEGVLRPMRTP